MVQYLPVLEASARKNIAGWELESKAQAHNLLLQLWGPKQALSQENSNTSLAKICSGSAVDSFSSKSYWCRFYKKAKAILCESFQESAAAKGRGFALDVPRGKDY